jgi:hypothetical protein
MIQHSSKTVKLKREKAPLRNAAVLEGICNQAFSRARVLVVRSQTSLGPKY